MKIFSFFILFIFISNISLGFDLKKLGDSLQKDLGGALKELEKGLSQSTNNKNNNTQKAAPTSPTTDKRNNNVWKDKNGNIKCTKDPRAPLCNYLKEVNERAKVRHEKNNCYVTYTASNGEVSKQKYGLPGKDPISGCEMQRRYYLLYVAKDIEAYVDKLKREENEKKRKIADANKREKDLQSRKKNKDPRGQWGVSFNNTAGDLKAKNCDIIYPPNMICENEDKVNTFIMMGKNGFPYHFYRSFGAYSTSGISKYSSKLKDRYKVIKSPTKEEREKFIFGKKELIYYYKNQEKNSKKPLYISLYTRTMGSSRTIYIGYYSKNYFEDKILSALKKKKKKEDDL